MKITKEGIAIIAGDTHISKWVEESGRLDHDQNMLPLVLPFIKEGDTVIDAGAFIGDHTIAYAKKVGEEGLVIAFEPNEEAMKCLKYNMNDTGCVKIFYQLILGDSITNHRMGGNENAGATHVIKGYGNIHSTTLDNLQLKSCDFIKLDVEGFEVKALRGARETITKFKPVLLIEINKGALARNGNDEHDIFQILDGMGYEYRNVYPGQPMEGEQYDIICVEKKLEQDKI